MLTVINGPMFSGKTSMLISIANANIVAGNRVKIYKPSNDTRSAGELITHDGISVAAEIIDKECVDIIIDDLIVSVILFDEAQFFNRINLMYNVKWLLDLNYTVVCAGLSQDSSGNTFGAMPKLLAIADEIINLKAVCSKCRGINVATRTYRRGNSKEQIIVGGKELYEARCYRCWRDND